MIEQIRRCDQCREVIPTDAKRFEIAAEVTRINGTVYEASVKGEFCQLDCLTKAVQHAATSESA